MTRGSRCATHEPSRRRRAGYDFTGASSSRWLREALKWQLKIALETGLLRWASVLARLCSLTIFSQFIAAARDRRAAPVRRSATICGCWRWTSSATSSSAARRCGANRGELISNATVRNIVDRRRAVLRVHGRPQARGGPRARRAALGGARRSARAPVAPGREAPRDAVARRGRLLRRSHDGAGHAPRRPARRRHGGGRDRRRAGDADPDAARPHRPTRQRAAAAGLRLPAADRRPRRASSDSDPDAIVAKLRFQQTKIEGAPDTIFVDSEVVAIVRAQQQWVHAHAGQLLRDQNAPPPRYLFLAITRNHRGRHSYPKTTRHPAPAPARRAGGHPRQPRTPPPAVTTCTASATPARTSLINAGVPVHVVQRYLGHLSPEMTMRYAHTLRETHEREFLRYKKITADGSDLDLDPRDLFALIELGKRTDRVLPNGLCMLPPRQTCNRGNACLTCDKFTTDASYLPEHEQQLGQAQRADRAATGRLPRANRRGDDHQQRVARAAPHRAARTARRSSPCSRDPSWPSILTRPSAARAPAPAPPTSPPTDPPREGAADPRVRPGRGGPARRARRSPSDSSTAMSKRYRSTAVKTPRLRERGRACSMGCPATHARPGCSASGSRVPPSSAGSTPPPASRHAIPDDLAEAVLAASAHHRAAETDGTRESGQPARRRAAQAPSRDPARRDRARRAHQRTASRSPSAAWPRPRACRSTSSTARRCAPASSNSAPTSKHTPPRRAEPQPEADQPASQSNVVRTLTAQLADLKRNHGAEITRLETALAAAQGENLELRRQVGRQSGA